MLLLPTSMQQWTRQQQQHRQQQQSPIIKTCCNKIQVGQYIESHLEALDISVLAGWWQVASTCSGASIRSKTCNVFRSTSKSNEEWRTFEDRRHTCNTCKPSWAAGLVLRGCLGPWDKLGCCHLFPMLREQVGPSLDVFVNALDQFLAQLRLNKLGERHQQRFYHLSQEEALGGSSRALTKTSKL